MSYLRRFPFDRIKIDRSFVQALDRDADAGAIVRAILALARSLRLEVTAEGVETKEQLELLRAERCQHAQGFLLGRPVPAAGLREFLAVPPTAMTQAEPLRREAWSAWPTNVTPLRPVS